MSRAGPIALLGIMALAPAQIVSRPSGATAPVGLPHLDRQLQGDVLGSGQMYTVRWYHVGPLPQECPKCPPAWVRGVEVLGAAGARKSRIIATWVSRSTPIPTFYTELNRLWPVPSGGDSISVAVQYGGRLLYLYMLRLEGNALKEVWRWRGMNASVTRISDRLVLKTQSDDYFQVPRLYAWTGKDFGDVSRDFPSFYAKVGASYARPIEEPVLSGVLAENCQLVLQAYVLAGRPELGRKSCLQLRKRILAGRGVNDVSWQNWPAVRRQNAAKIDSLLAQQRSGQWPAEF